YPGKRPEIDYVALSPDGTFVAVSVSLSGSEDGTVSVYETATGKKRDDVVLRASSAIGGAAVWKADGSGFYYSHFPRALPDKVVRDRLADPEIRFHRLGDSSGNDAIVLGKGLPPYTLLTP